jgi:ribosomal protein L37AE/L43A
VSNDEKYDMKGLLSDLLEKAKKREGLEVVRLRDEIKKRIESEDEIIRKFLGLLASFKDIIPKEKQRYNAAIRALSATSGVSRQNVLESANNQLENLKQLEKRVLSSLPGLRDELKAMESRSREIKDEIAQLREKILQFEKEEQEIVGSMAARESELNIVEGAVSNLFADIGAEISRIREKIEEFTAEKVSPQPIAAPDSIERHKPEGEKGGIEEEGKIEEPPATQETEWAKKCPMCGGKMNFHTKEAMWMCYSCGHDESTKGEDGGASVVATASEPAPTTEPAPSAMPATVTEPAVAPEDKLFPVASAPDAAPAASSPSVKKPVPRKKTCPACSKQMDWHEKEKSWQCPFCDYQRRVF